MLRGIHISKMIRLLTGILILHTSILHAGAQSPGFQDDMMRKMDELGLWDMANIEDVKHTFPLFSAQYLPYSSLNFGVVLNNSRYKIYRSKALGARGVKDLFRHMERHDLDIPTKVIFMNKEGYSSWIGSYFWSKYTHFLKGIHNFAYEQAKLFSKDGEYPNIDFHHPLNDNVYLSGKDPVHDVVSHNLDRLVDDYIREYFRKDMEKKDIKHSIYGTKKNLYYVLSLILENKGPVLFHCTGGLHRTGMIALSLRYLQGGVWTKPFSYPLTVKIGFMKRRAKLHNLAEVEYYLHNSRQLRKENFNSIRKLVREDAFIKLKEKYQSDLNLPILNN